MNPSPNESPGPNERHPQSETPRAGQNEPKSSATTAVGQAGGKTATEQLPENVAGMLCYLFGWASGLVFLLLDRRPFVRFHAAQSVAVFATLNILLVALSGFFLGALLPGIGGALLALRHFIVLLWLIAAVILMLKAAAGERFRVRMASGYADRAANGIR